MELRFAPRVRRWIAVHDTRRYAADAQCVLDACGESCCSRDAAEHNWTRDEAAVGIVRAVNEFIAANSAWEVAVQHDVNSGLTLLQRVQAPPPAGAFEAVPDAA